MASPWKAATAPTLKLCALWLCVLCLKPAEAQYGAPGEGVPPPPDCSDCSLCETHCQPAALPPPPPTQPPPPPPPSVVPSYGTPPPAAEGGNCPPAAVIQCCPYPPPSPHAYLPYYNYSASSRPPAPLLPFLAAPLAWTVAAAVVVLAPGPRPIY